MTFQKETDFEEALIKVLADKGWEKEVIKNPTEQDLIRNWAKILYDNNRGIDRLNNYPLTDGEMQQIIEQITELRTPLKLNGFINGKTVSVKRDNPDDKLHFGTEISLKIYDRREIAAGQSRYQIVQQPVFPSKSKMQNDRRGDLMLLINGMPVIHIEMKRSGVPVSQAYNQIEKYSYEGVVTGLFSLVQVFVAMNPEETRYFANPGPDGKFNTDYYFHWADFNNEPINDWKAIASSLLSIPMAHQLIGFYTVADNADGVLKVMRSYQYYAASAISDVVSKTKWDSGKQRGGYIWHTTGSGKTMTSFKSAQLIANSNDADKVIFLTDRIELGTQSLKEYRAFADEDETVQATENTYVLLSKLKSNATADTLIVTSIQKMSNIRDEDGGLNASDIEIINGKRLVFIVDEAHRSTFGDMLSIIKETFPNAQGKKVPKAMNLGNWFKKNGSTILTCLGAGGMAATVVLAVKATPKAYNEMIDARIEKAEGMKRVDSELPKLTALETIRICWRDYLPAAAVGTASLVCIFGANALSRKQQASMAAAYTALASAFDGYREKVRSICGPGTDAMIEKAVEQEKRDVEDDRPPWDEVQTFYLPCGGKAAFFERTMEEVMQAEYHINRNLALRGGVTLNEFLSFLGLDPVEEGDVIGWDCYIGETQHDYRWIDFNHRHYATDDGLTVCSIDTPFAPHSLDDSDYDAEDIAPTCGVD